MYKLLIVDDEPLVLAGVQSIIDWATLDVTIMGCAGNGKQAMDLMSRELPDIVMTDIRMPIMDGLELAQRSYSMYGRVPVFIFLTSYEDFNYAKTALQVDAVDYLIKLDINGELLSAAVNKAITAVNERLEGQASAYIPYDNSVNALREKFFIRLINGLIEDDSALDEQSALLDIGFNSNAYCVADCSLTKVGGVHGSNDLVSICSNAVILARDALSRYLPCQVLVLDISHFAVVFMLDGSSPDEYTAEIEKALRQTASALRGYLNVMLLVSVGSFVDNRRDICKSYSAAVLNSRELSVNSSIVFFDPKMGCAPEFGQPDGESCSESDMTEQTIDRVKSYIRTNYSSRLTLGSIARVFNFTPNHISRLFARSDDDLRFVAFVTQVRVDAAKDIIQGGGCRVNQIAEAVGFESPFYFSKVFRKSEGMSPREYIKAVCSDCSLQDEA